MGSGLLPAPCGDGIGAAPGAVRRWDRGCSRRPAEMGSGLLPAPCGDGIGAAPGALRRWDRGCSRRPAEMGSGLLPAPCGDGIGAAPGALRRWDRGCSRRPAEIGSGLLPALRGVRGAQGEANETSPEGYLAPWPMFFWRAAGGIPCSVSQLAGSAGQEKARNPWKGSSTSCPWDLQRRSCACTVAPQPGAALTRHGEMLWSGQRPLTAQKPKEQLALPGNGGTGCLQSGSDSNSWFRDPTQLQDIKCQAIASEML
ncbi:uncharacterized protein [Taeniopygia guttata]|uniref:uncharacterized protein isoform X1 n=1 Tax=Taeniopygia guttata TaxID=59729 RepID=UPI003BB873E2